MSNIIADNSVNTSMYRDLVAPADLTPYTLMRGTPDFANLKQFNNYEKGFPLLVVVTIPTFLKTLASVGSGKITNSLDLNYNKSSSIYNNNDGSLSNLINQYIHILEYEFRGLSSGIENLTSSTQEISNGNQAINVITKTEGITGTNFSMQYTEKAGEPITRVHELYLRSLRDPANNYKTYGGLIGTADYADLSQVGFENETFSFMYMHTDNTGLQINRAVYWVGCQPTTAELSIYNAEKGSVEFAEVSAEFTGFPIMGEAINERARDLLNWINSSSNDYCIRRNSWNYNYTGTRSGQALEAAASNEDVGINHVSSSIDLGVNTSIADYDA